MDVFQSYCGKETTMDGKSFAKLAKDLKLLDKNLTATDVDLAFAKIKDKAARRISFSEFQNGLNLLAQKKGISETKLFEIVTASHGPILVGTKAEAVKYHDDKSLYTGVHANGGPSTVDPDKMSDISQLCDRTAADVRGSKVQQVHGVTDQLANFQFEESKKESDKPKIKAQTKVVSGPECSSL